MTFPSLRTVLTVRSGTSGVQTRVFPWGTRVEPFAVGAQGAWAVSARGVESIHFYIGFDGRLIHVAAASASVQLFIDASPVGQTWVPLPIGSELRFGEARIGATCEELPTAPVGAFGTVLQRGPSEPPPAAKAPVLGFVTVQPVAVQARPVQPSAGASPRTVAIDAPRPLPLAAPEQQPQPIPAPAPLLAPLPRPAAADDAPRAAMATAPSVRRPLDQVRSVLPIAQDGTTVSDEGALRNLAAQVAQAAASPGNLAASDVYLAEVQRNAGSRPPLGDPVSPAAPVQHPERPPMPGLGDEGLRPAHASPPLNPVSDTPKPTTPSPDASVEMETVSPLKKIWRDTSWVMKLTLVLLPFAGYFGLFWEPTEEEALSPVARAPVALEAQPVVTASGGVPLAKPVASTTPSAPVTLASVEAPDEPTPALADSSSSPSTVRSAEAGPPPTLGAQPREALRLAFEGRLSEAARRYERLSEVSDQRLFSLAARLAREQAVRKP